jgi:hypothetical protein
VPAPAANRPAHVGEGRNSEAENVARDGKPKKTGRRGLGRQWQARDRVGWASQSHAN